MKRQNVFLRVFAAAVFVVSFAVAASAQVTQIAGKVTMKQADGTVVPVANAQIDIYRLDIKGQFETKTNRRGEYTHAGIPFGGRYAIAVSAPGAAPTFTGNLRLHQQPENNFELSPGDGRRMTLEEIRASLAGAPSTAGSGAPQPSAEDKKAAAEMAAKIKEVEEQNKKITQSNEVVARTFKTGNEALQASRFDEAIAAYNEGLAAREEVALFTNRAEALRLRGAARYNEGLRNTDEAGRKTSLDAAQKDWRDALASTSKAIELLKAAPAGGAADPGSQAQSAGNRLAALGSHARVLSLLATRVDKTPARADEAYAAFQDYINAETDAARKNKAMFEAANVYFEVGQYDRAIAEFQKVIAADPNNAEAYFKLGSSLMNTGDKAKFQEAANYLGKFAEIAPDTNPLKADAKSLLQFLKEQENVKPMKIETPRTGRRRG
ncbi:MAG TPA: tetratricopeptide repeat protein [Pyrinomonadaceae bacterium]|nr:tetratricopeptide repeat protein [Pyrinomonadaceae bacterium]